MNSERLDETEEEEFDTEALAKTIVESVWDLKAHNAVAIDLRGRVSYTDFVVICTGTSERHVQAIARNAQTKVKQETGVMPYGVEGLDNGGWGLIDFGDVILHIFNGTTREDYDLERMWTEAPRLEVEGKPADLYGHFELDAFENE